MGNANAQLCTHLISFFCLLSSCVDLVIMYCRVLLKRTILELELTAALYFSKLRVRLLAGDTDNIFTICTYIYYDVFKLVRDRSSFLSSIFFLFWGIFSKHPVVVCGDEFIGWVSPCGWVCYFSWCWRPALIEHEQALSDVLLCTRRNPVFLVHMFLLQQGLLQFITPSMMVTPSTK